jgi:uncharacterized protein (DUF433 family)
MTSARTASKEHRSFRLERRLVEDLRRQARESGESLTALAERYLAEGLRQEEHPLIVFRSGAMGRRPALAGTRLDVAQVIETVRHSDNSTEAAAEYLSIPESWVRASVRYYADFPEEVDRWLERLRAIAEREEDAWRRAQAALA